MWDKNTMDLSDAQIAEAQKILAKYNLQVTDIASPLFKTDWPDAPRSQFSTTGDMHGAVDIAFKQQDEILERAIASAKQFKTDKVRCFDFWRLDDVAPYREAIDEKLRSAAEVAGKQDILLVLENEFACNTATGREAVRTLSAVPSPHFVLNWDPCNAVMRGELDAFPAAGTSCPKIAFTIAIEERREKRRRQNRIGLPSTRESSTGQRNSALSSKLAFTTLSVLRHTGRAAEHRKQSSRICWAGMKQALKDSKTL